MTDTKKFWLTTFIYWIIFWLLPIITFNSLFGFFDNIFIKFKIAVPSILIYFFCIIPLIIIFLYIFFIHKLKIKYKNIIFASLYILLPYISVILFFFLHFIRYRESF